MTITALEQPVFLLSFAKVYREAKE